MTANFNTEDYDAFTCKECQGRFYGPIGSNVCGYCQPDWIVFPFVQYFFQGVEDY